MKILHLIPLIAFLLFFSLPLTGNTQKPARKPPAPEVLIQRTWMPNAHPGSFAVGFPSQLNYCFDPVEMVVAYAWSGNFVDLQPTFAGKFPRNAKLQGEVFYFPTEASAFSRNNSPEPPERQFKGYRVRNGAPRFHFTVDAMPVQLTVRPTENGLLQRFQIESWNKNLLYRPADPSQVTLLKGDGTWIDGTLHFPEGAEIEFTERIAR